MTEPEQQAATQGPDRSAASFALFVVGIASMLSQSGVRLTGFRDSRGIALVRVPGQEALEPVDHVVSLLLAHNITQLMAAEELRKRAEESAKAEGDPAPAPAPGTIGAGMVIGGPASPTVQ